MDQPIIGAYYFLLSQKKKDGQQQYMKFSLRFMGRDLGGKYVFASDKWGILGRIAPEFIEEAKIKRDETKPINLNEIKP